MIIFIYGIDTYRSREKLKEIIEHYKKTRKSGLNLNYFDGQDPEYEDFQDKIWQSVIFKERKLIIFKNFFPSRSLKESLLRDLKRFADSSDVFIFYEKEKIPENDKLFKLLKKHGESQEFKTLGGPSLRNWARKEIEKYGAKTDTKTVEELINLAGNDSWQISNEIKKIVSYGKNKEIRLEDLRLLVKPKIEPDIFRTIDAIASKNKREALRLLKKHLEKGDHPLYLLKMINFQLRNLLIVKSSRPEHPVGASHSRTTVNKLGLHPFVLKKAIQQAEKFSLGELKKIYLKLFEADINIKTGKIEPETALDLLIAGI